MADVEFHANQSGLAAMFNSAGVKSMLADECAKVESAATAETRLHSPMTVPLYSSAVVDGTKKAVGFVSTRALGPKSNPVAIVSYEAKHHPLARSLKGGA